MYSSFYGLKQEPFRLTPDPRFLHLAEPHRNTLRAMVEGVAGRKGLQVSIGPIGTGKTTLLYCLQHILAHESRRERPVRSAFVVNPTLTPDELFESLFDELEIHPVNVLQIILCGQPELMPLLQRPELAALRQRISIVTRLRELTLMESRAYIAERLHVAGLRGDGPFTTAGLEEIYRLTGGVPRLINSLCDHTLEIGCRRQAKKLGPDFVNEAAEEMGISQLSSGNSESPSLPPAGLAATGS
jgi:general secretion pathway protein A